jgi:DNA transformation protein
MTPEYRGFIADLFDALGSIEIRRVFNFEGLYRGGIMFGLVADEQVYLKTNAASRSTFEREGSSPLRYKPRDGVEIAMSYYELPRRLYDDPEEAAKWALTALEIAARSPNSVRKVRRQSKKESPTQRLRGRPRKTVR